MSFEAELVGHLMHASITAIVDDRITPLVRDQESTLPALVYTPFAPDQVNNLSGRDGKLRFWRVQLDCWGRSYADVVRLAEAVRARMDTAATNFRAVMIPGAGFDDYESDTRLFRKSMDFNCSFNET